MYAKHIPREKLVIGIAATYKPIVLADEKKTRLNSNINLAKTPNYQTFGNFRTVCFKF